MTLYQKLTKIAVNTGGTAGQAWAAAISQLESGGVGTPTTRAKGCPKAAFVSLGDHGLIRGITPSSAPGNLSENALHLLQAHELLLHDATWRQRKGAWWRAVAQARGTSRQSQNGVLDVLEALVDAEALIRR